MTHRGLTIFRISYKMVLPLYYIKNILFRNNKVKLKWANRLFLCKLIQDVFMQTNSTKRRVFDLFRLIYFDIDPSVIENFGLIFNQTIWIFAD